MKRSSRLLGSVGAAEASVDCFFWQKAAALQLSLTLLWLLTKKRGRKLYWQTKSRDAKAHIGNRSDGGDVQNEKRKARRLTTSRCQYGFS